MFWNGWKFEIVKYENLQYQNKIMIRIRSSIIYSWLNFKTNSYTYHRTQKKKMPRSLQIFSYQRKDRGITWWSLDIFNKDLVTLKRFLYKFRLIYMRRALLKTNNAVFLRAALTFLWWRGDLVLNHLFSNFVLFHYFLF